MVWLHIANRAKDSKDVHFSMLVYYRATYSKHFQELSGDVNHEQIDMLAVGAKNTSDSEHKAPRIPTNSTVHSFFSSNISAVLWNWRKIWTDYLL